MRIVPAITLLLILFMQPLHAEEDSYIPDYAVAQFAGNIGFLSAGAGYTFYDERLNAELIYGYVPESVGGIDIHMITQRTIYTPYKIPLSNGYSIQPLALSFLINYAIGGQYNVLWPDHYPDWYYRPTAIYTGSSIGIRMRKELNEQFIKAFEFYLDVVTLNEYVFLAIENDSVKLVDIVSLAIGSRLYF